MIRSVILTPVTASATSQGLVCSAAPKTRSSRPAFPGDRHRPRSAVTRAIVFGFLGGPCSCSLFRNRALLDASHRSALHFLSHFVDSPRSDFRVLPEGFPGIPGSPELSVKLHLHKRLPHDLLASALLGALAVKPGLADRATSERRPTQRATHNTARLSAHPPAPLHPCPPGPTPPEKPVALSLVDRHVTSWVEKPTETRINRVCPLRLRGRPSGDPRCNKQLSVQPSTRSTEPADSAFTPAFSRIVHMSFAAHLV